MNPYSGYQLYQVQRARTRAEILADDARRGRQAAAVVRVSRALGGCLGRAASPGGAAAAGWPFPSADLTDGGA